MWNFEKIILKNFISHENSEFIFQKDKLTLIFGKNCDDNNNGANSNGSGKSSIIEAITTLLTGETYRDVGKDDFIMDDTDEAEIDGYLYNDFLNKKLRIHWKFRRGKSATVKIYENGSKENKKELTGVPETKKYILEQIGISREDLLNFFIINQDNDNSFFTSGDAKQKEIIGRFANYNVINNVIDSIEEERDKLIESKNKIENSVETQQGIIYNFQDLIKEEKEKAASTVEDLVTELESKIDQLVKKREDLESSVPDKQELIIDYKKSVKELEEEIKEFEEIIESIEDLKESNNKSISELSKINLKINSNKSSLEHTLECPKCKHEFILDSDLSIDQLKKNIIDLQEEKKTKEKEIADNKELLESMKEQEESLKKVKKKRKDKLDSIEQIEEEIQSDKFQIKKCNNSIRHNQEQIEEHKKQSEEKTNIAAYELKIKETEEELEKSNKQLKTIIKKINEKEFWLIHLGKKGFMTFLANRCISTVEGLCNHFLESMRINLRVKIDGYKVLASGELRDKINIQIVRNGYSLGNFNKYSGGQKERVNLSGILTFQRLINNSLNGKGLNLLCLDESLDHLDEKGQQICLGILQMFNITTFIITHNKVENLIDNYNKIVVEYKDGKSVIGK